MCVCVYLRVDVRVRVYLCVFARTKENKISAAVCVCASYTHVVSWLLVHLFMLHLLVHLLVHLLWRGGQRPDSTS